MENFKSLITQYQDYLTFYHECRIPKHPFFDIKANKSDGNLLVVSSPSRMGNHLLMSMLDGHPELPSVPGEDGFHMFSFSRANYDIYDLMQTFRGQDVDRGLMDIASNGGGSKWEQFKKVYNDACVDQVGYSGVGAHSSSAIVDFEGVVFDVDYDSYVDYLTKRKSILRKARNYNEVLSIYIKALGVLVPQKNSQYDGYIVHGAMRTQLLWLCETMPNVKILSSVRSFESYAISQIKSRHGDVALSEDLLQEAWEHWFHKVVDMLYLRLHYPRQFGLVTFDDLVAMPDQTQKVISKFLGISPNNTMNQATIMGIPVKGNSWKSRVEQVSGGFYKPQKTLESKQVPIKAHEIWGLVENCKL